MRWTCLADPFTAAYSSTILLYYKPNENADDTTVDLYNYANVVYSLGNAPIYQVFYNKTSSIALLTRFISKLKNPGIIQGITLSNK